MIEITVEALKDYCTCPQLYINKHIENVHPPRAKTTAGFDGHSHIMIKAQEAIDNIVGFYFHRLMDDRQVRYQTLYHRWQNEWWSDFTGEDIANYIVPVSRANMIKINTGFINNLPRFYKKFHKPFRPLVVDKDMIFPSGNILLSSNIQMAYPIKEDLIRIVKFIPYKIAPGPPEKDISLLAQACSWLRFYDQKKIEISYYCMLSCSEYDPFTVSSVNLSMVDNLDKLLRAFENKETIGTINCAGCEFSRKEK